MYMVFVSCYSAIDFVTGSLYSRIILLYSLFVFQDALYDIYKVLRIRYWCLFPVLVCAPWYLTCTDTLEYGLVCNIPSTIPLSPLQVYM